MPTTLSSPRRRPVLGTCFLGPPSARGFAPPPCLAGPVLWQPICRQAGGVPVHPGSSLLSQQRVWLCVGFQAEDDFPQNLGDQPHCLSGPTADTESSDDVLIQILGFCLCLTVVDAFVHAPRALESAHFYASLCTSGGLIPPVRGNFPVLFLWQFPSLYFSFLFSFCVANFWNFTSQKWISWGDLLIRVSFLLSFPCICLFVLNSRRFSQLCHLTFLVIVFSQLSYLNVQDI